MSETTTVSQEPISSPEPSIAELAAFAFNEPISQPANSQAEEAAVTANTQGQEGQPTSPVVATPAPTEPQEEIVDDLVYLKQQTGFEDWDSLKAAIEEYNGFKTKPPTPQEPQFSNEDAKRWYEYLKNGKEDDLYNNLHGRRQVKNLDSMSDEQKLKLYIKMQNPRFDDELIADEYNSLYNLNEEDEKFIDDKGAVDQLKLRKEKVRMAQRIENDVQKANEYFSQYKTKIELPDIQPQQSQTVDEDYEGFKASNAQAVENYNTVIAPAIKALQVSDVNLGFNVNDANNQMQFDVAIAPDPQDFETARQDALSVVAFLEKTCYDANGKFMPTALQRLMLIGRNYEKYGQVIARQAVNAERKRVIEKNTAGNGGERRNYNITPEQKTQLEQEAQMAFSV